ncbi:MAG: GNAT family N-acetyltransferase [Spirochaeta sp.]
MNIQFRKAQQSDAESISQLIHDSALFLKEKDFYDNGWMDFIGSIAKENIVASISDPATFMMIALDNGEVVGIITLKRKSRVNQLFVSPGYRNSGIGKRLWELCKCEIVTAEEIESIQVNSSSYAKQFYIRQGFVVTGGLEKKNGFIFTPMEYRVR